MRTLTSLLCASALLLGAASCGDDEPTAAGGPSATSARDGGEESPDRASPSSTPASSSIVPTTVSADPLAVGSYLATDGSRPALLPSCYGLFGACLGSPIEQLTAMLGPGSRADTDQGELRFRWTVENRVYLTVGYDAIGSIRFFLVQGSRVGLPDGLVLGEATAGDVQATYGEQACEDEVGGPGFRCPYLYSVLGGTVTISFLAAQEEEATTVEERSAVPIFSVFIGYADADGR